MTSLPDDPVVAALREPHGLLNLETPAWDRLVRVGRRANLLARLASQAHDLGLAQRMPTAPWAHFEAERLLASAQQDESRREVEHIRRALEPLGVPIILLKGAAYLMAGLPPAAGRIFSDIDILVPREKLGETEATLMLNGWATTHHSDYDQKYYRTWMHELPPLEHIHRHTVLDVHHAILPDTARQKPDSRKLLDAARPLAPGSCLYVLSSTDIVLHSMAHLFHNEELSHGLRDLSDLDLLLRHYGHDSAYWTALVARASELDLARTLHYGLRYSHLVLATPIPQMVLDAAGDQGGPPALLAGWMDGLWLRALRAPHPLTSDPLSGSARFLLYLRAHWLRMPPLLLARHLATKAMTRRESSTTD